MAKNKTKLLNNLLKVFAPDKTAVDFSEFDAEVEKLKSALKEKIQVQTIDDVNSQLERFKNHISLEPVVSAMKRIEEKVASQHSELMDEFEQKSLELDEAINNKEGDTKSKITSLRINLEEIGAQLASLEEVRKKDIETIKKSIPDVTDIESMLNELSLETTSRLDALEEFEIESPKDWTTDIGKQIDELRAEILTRISGLGGGAMNRQIFVNGVDPLLKYTDVNLKPGANVTITYQNNETTKKVDITISSTGGGGGNSRLIQSIATSQTAGSTAGIDYVYLCSGTLTLTMPTTVGNTDLYTVKNIGAGVVTVNTTGGETIDGSLTAVMPLQYTSIDLISNNSGNWNIT